MNRNHGSWRKDHEGWRSTLRLMNCRTRNLWALSPNLNFGKDDVRDNHAFVSRVLDLYKGSTVESLRIALDRKNFTPLYVVDDCLSHASTWLEFANKKRVQTLELEFFYQMTSKFLQFPVFERLKSLSLSSISLTDDDFRLLLSVNLETLSLRHVESLKRVQITAPRLKQLTIVGCLTITTIDLNSAPNLQYFKHCDNEREFPMQNLSFNSVTKLSSLCLCGPFHVYKSLIKLKNIGVEKLVMDMINVRGSLKKLELRFVAGHSAYCMYNLISTIINACPHLEKMTLNYNMLKEHNHDVVEFNNTFKHSHLQVVEFIGWCGLESELQLTNYLIGTCTNLRKLVFDSNPPQDRQWCHGYSTNDMEQPDVKAAILNAEKQLMNRKSGYIILYAGADLEIEFERGPDRITVIL